MSFWDPFIISNNCFGHKVPQKAICSRTTLLEMPNPVDAPFILYVALPRKGFCGFRLNFGHCWWIFREVCEDKASSVSQLQGESVLQVGFRDCKLHRRKLLGLGGTCSSLLTYTTFCISVTCLCWGQPYLLSGDGYKPTVNYATGTGMGNSLFRRLFKQTSCMQYILLYDALCPSGFLASPVVLISPARRKS